jgi:chromosome segregation protein
MLLKRLELIGFKSFANKTVLDFSGGIAGVVGPNGSGKSNIIDAVRWVLGEREAKNLRGDKVEDLIFAGTQSRARTGMAQVSLIFDNSTGFFPVDFSEVSIVKRIGREGHSQYFLNKAEVRLKDIVSFFAKARLGTHGLTIINQGEGDLFVKSSPEERREMIEEILGLRQYQIKKKEAERKLKNTNINIDKVKAVIEEIIPHLRFLKRQTAKWEKLSETEKQLNDLERIYFKNKLKEIFIELDKFTPRLKEIDENIFQKTKELKVLQEELHKVETSRPNNRAQLDDIQVKKDELFSKKSEQEKELGRFEAKIEFSSLVKIDSQKAIETLKDLRSVIKDLSEENDLENLKSKLNDVFLKIDNFLNFGSEQGASSELLDLRKSKDDLSNKIIDIVNELEEFRKAENNISSGLESFNFEFKKAFEKVESKKDELAGLESDKNRINFNAERFNLKLQDLKTQIEQAGKDINELKSNLDNTDSVSIFEVERKILKLKAEIASAGEIDHVLLDEFKETESRHNFLSTQLIDLEKASNDLNVLIKDLDFKIHNEFTSSLDKINEEFNKFFQLMFGGGKAKLYLEKIKPKKRILPDESLADNEQTILEESEDEENEVSAGIEIDLSLPRKKIRGLEMLSGGEKSLLSIAVLFALISVSPPPFLVLDEIDAALDERNTRRFAELIKDFSKQSQFIIVTHNRATMEAADILYGVTMEESGVSKVLSIDLKDKLE